MWPSSNHKSFKRLPVDMRGVEVTLQLCKDSSSVAQNGELKSEIYAQLKTKILPLLFLVGIKMICIEESGAINVTLGEGLRRFTHVPIRHYL